MHFQVVHYEWTKKYLLDSNCLITAKNTFYSFDFAPSFWEQMKKCLDDGTILIHDSVYQELVHQSDDLAQWVKDNTPPGRINNRSAHAMLNYQKVMDHLRTCGYYKPRAIADWAVATVADPQLIASALTTGHTIVTLETESKDQRSKKNPQKRAKIPDIAFDLGADCIGLYEMMRALHFKL